MTASIAVLLAAGKGTRMQSDLPKVLHEVCGRPMLLHVLDAVRAAGVERSIVVVGHGAEQVRAALADHGDVEFVLQAEQKGTGHAVMMCREALADYAGALLVLAGDTPLLKSSSLVRLIEARNRSNAACVVGTAVTEANQGLGRIVRDESGAFARIVEQRDCTPEQSEIREINTGCYVFDCTALLGALGELRDDNRQGEYYLTDCPAILKSQGAVVLAEAGLGIEEAMGINTREQLADVERALADRRDARE